MSEPEHDSKERNRQIAENESERQAVSSVRISSWAITIAVIVGLVAFGWVLLSR